MKNLYNENYKTDEKKKKNPENIKKWEDIPFSWNGRTLKMSASLKQSTDSA